MFDALPDFRMQIWRSVGQGRQMAASFFPASSFLGLLLLHLLLLLLLLLVPHSALVRSIEATLLLLLPTGCPSLPAQ